MKNIKLSTITGTILMVSVMVTGSSAHDTITDSNPKLYFDDTRLAGGPESAFGMFASESFSGNYMTGPKGIFMYHYVANDDSYNTLDIGYSNELRFELGVGNIFISDSSGDINLADGSVFIDKSVNRMGIGTVVPLKPLHVMGDMRLTASSYNWTLNTGGDGLWFINNSAPALMIRNSAPSNTLVVGYNATGKEGNVGIGTMSPAAKLDVRGDIASTGDLNLAGSFTAALVEDNTLKVEFPMALSRTNNASGEHSDVGFTLENKTDGHNGSFKWSFQTSWSNEGFTATKDDTGGYEFVVKNPTDDVNKVELAAAGKTFFKNGALVNPSSRAFKDDIKTLDAKAALEAFAKLEPVTFVYKEHKGEQVVGFIAEDVPELVAINGRDGVNATEIVAVLTKVVQEQDKKIAEQDKVVQEQGKVMVETRAELKAAQEKIAKLEAMQKRVAQLESILTNLALDTSNTKKEKVSVSLK